MFSLIAAAFIAGPPQAPCPPQAPPVREFSADWVGTRVAAPPQFMQTQAGGACANGQCGGGMMAPHRGLFVGFGRRGR